MIVEAAFKAIAKEGFGGLRTRDIAKLVGINSATLHHHFPTKENLIAAVADHLHSRFRAEHTQGRELEQAAAQSKVVRMMVSDVGQKVEEKYPQIRQ